MHTTEREFLQRLVSDRFASRLFAQDAGLWGEAATAEASRRLGWVDFSARAEPLLAEIRALRDALRARGIHRFVLCGMGGSSLGPGVIVRHDGAELEVLDSTHPAAVAAVLSGDLSRTIAIVSSKSGGTVETLSHRAALTETFSRAGLDPAQHIAIVTDPGSALDVEAESTGERVFHADPNVGGRFSVLTAFGLVPAGLAGARISRLLEDAEAARESLRRDDAANPALRLAAAIAAGLPEHYVLELLESRTAACGLGMWIEQLIAESTGKDGTGILPLDLPADAAPSNGAPSRLVRLSTEGKELTVSIDPTAHHSAADHLAEIRVDAPLGAQFLLWEVTTAALGRLLEVDPFDQPDVESAKRAAREHLGAPSAPDRDWCSGFAGSEVSGIDVQHAADASPISADRILAQLRDELPENGYLAIQAYADPHGAAASGLETLRGRLSAALTAPVSLGWGPRYLHSVGQFHKGGRPLGTFLQVIDDSTKDVSIPPGELSFSELMRAQANGDARVLRERGRCVVQVRATDLNAVVDGLLAQATELR